MSRRGVIYGSTDVAETDVDVHIVMMYFNDGSLFTWLRLSQ